MIIYACDRCHLKGIPSLMSGFKRIKVAKRDLAAVPFTEEKEMDLCNRCLGELREFLGPQPQEAKP